MATYLDENSSRKSGFRYQRAIPASLRPLFRGAKRWSQHIRAMPLQEAKKIAASLALRHDRLIAVLKTLDDQQRAEVAAAGGWKAWKIANPDAMRRLALEWAEAAEVGDVADGMTVFDAWERGRGRVHDGIVVDDPDLFAVSIRRVARALQPSAAKAAAVLAKADRPPDTTLAELCDLWAEGSKSPRKHQETIRLLETFLGKDVDTRTITSANIIAFRDQLDTTDRQKRVRLGHLKNIFDVAVEAGKLPVSPVPSVSRPRRKGQRNRKPISLFQQNKNSFTREEVRTILSHVENKKWGGKYHLDCLWALRLAFSTGARCKELCQLRKDDVTRIDGVPVILIHEGHEDQSVKNPGSARIMPLHAAVADGFLEYAEKAKGPWVFSFKDRKGEQRRAGYLQDNFGELLKDCKITRDVSLHHTRHTFIDRMRAAGVPEDKRHANVGHREAGTHGGYGDGFDLASLAAEVAKVMEPLG